MKYTYDQMINFIKSKRNDWDNTFGAKSVVIITKNKSPYIDVPDNWYLKIEPNMQTLHCAFALKDEIVYQDVFWVEPHNSNNSIAYNIPTKI